MQSISGPGIPMQPAKPTDCRHSKAGFHCTFTSVAARRDLSDAAKLLHAALVSMIRRRLDWTQAEIAAELGWGCRQKVWRATGELVAAGLLVVRRLGLGRPNEYILLPTAEISPEDIAARAKPDRGGRAGHQEGRRPNTPARAFLSDKEKTKERIDIRATKASDYYQTSEGWSLKRPT